MQTLKIKKYFWILDPESNIMVKDGGKELDPLSVSKYPQDFKKCIIDSIAYSFILVFIKMKEIVTS